MKTEILVKVLFIFVLAAGIGLVRLAGADPAEGAVPAGEGGAEGQVDLAETGTVTGTVHTSDTGLPLPNMQVDANFFEYSFGTCTDENGNYKLLLPPGEYILSFSYIGYGDKSVKVTILPGEVYQQDIGLRPAAIELNTAVVSASRYEQRLSDVTVSM